MLHAILTMLLALKHVSKKSNVTYLMHPLCVSHFRRISLIFQYIMNVIVRKYQVCSYIVCYDCNYFTQEFPITLEVCITREPKTIQARTQYSAAYKHCVPTSP